MKTAAAYLFLVVMPIAFGQNTPQQDPSGARTRYCRADETFLRSALDPPGLPTCPSLNIRRKSTTQATKGL